MRKMKIWNKKIALITMLISLFIFSSLMIFDSTIGGNATNGKLDIETSYVKNNEGILKEEKDGDYRFLISLMDLF